MERFYAESTDEEIRREKGKARKLRETPWWRQKKSRGICHYCGRRLPPSELTMDHLVPLVRGGRSVKANLVPACKDCNSKKKHMLPTEWAEYLARIREEDKN
jgi:5-methylcytosine-specific restriction endonuclease McrA